MRKSNFNDLENSSLISFNLINKVLVDIETFRKALSEVNEEKNQKFEALYSSYSLEMKLITDEIEPVELLWRYIEYYDLFINCYHDCIGYQKEELSDEKDEELPF